MKRLAVVLVIFFTGFVSSALQADIFRWDNGELIEGTEGLEPVPGINLSGFNLAYANLEESNLSIANLANANLSHADLTGASLVGATLVGAILHSATMSEVDLTNAILAHASVSGDLGGVNLTGANLTHVNLSLAVLSEADLTDAWIQDAIFETTGTGRDLTPEQLYSTASYKAGNLQGITFYDPSGFGVRSSKLNGWDFSAQNLRGSSFRFASLGDTIFDDSDVSFADFRAPSVGRHGPKQSSLYDDQLYSTSSYQQKRLIGIGLPENDLVGWNFESQNLVLANFGSSDLQDANFVGADLRNANFGGENAQDAQYDDSTIYNQWTVFATDFDPVMAGLTYIESQQGDFDASDSLDRFDIDLLAARIRHDLQHLPRDMFDLNSDSRIDSDDLRTWVKDYYRTWLGDANLDGEFNSGDLVDIFTAGEYEDVIPRNSGWSEGDWNADGDFTSGDLVAAFTDGGYEQGPRADVNAVPEPASFVVLITGLAGLATVSRTRRGRV